MVPDDIPLAQRQRSLPAAGRDPRLSTSLWAGLWAGVMVLVLVGLAIRGIQPQDVPVSASMAPPSSLELVPTATPFVPQIPTSLLGHRPFAEAPSDQLVTIGSYQGRSVQLHRRAAQAWGAMTQAAAQAGVILVPISGFRSIADQEYLFFQQARKRALRPQERALVSAPPGYSEHHTGYALDIGDGRDPSTDVELSFTRTAAWRWLTQNAARFGFELSFPENNPQGISFEPWHWRYVGDRESLETFYGDSRQ